MFIPNYQIHNILKDFTQQLKNDSHRLESGHRLEAVVNRVAGTIMDRVTHLSEDEAGHGAQIVNNPSLWDSRERSSYLFHYHTIGTNQQKEKQCLAVENSEQLINRFQSILDESLQNTERD